MRVVCEFYCALEWGATLCPLCVVDGQECPGLNASALTVFRMLSEMSATWCLNAKHCKQHGRILHTCLGPLLLLCSNLCGKETLYRLHSFVSECFAVLETLGVTYRTCLTCSSLSMIVYCV